MVKRFIRWVLLALLRLVKGCPFKVEVLKGPSGKWYWRLEGLNGEIVASSETYNSKQGCKDTAGKVMYNLGIGKIKDVV